MKLGAAVVFMLVAGPRQASAQEPTLPVSIFAAPGKGVSIRHGDDFLLTLRGRIQVRDTVTAGDAPTNELNVRTARLTLLGHIVTPNVRYQLQLAFGPGDFEANVPSPIFDAWVEYGGWRNLQVRVGQFFVPFDRARTKRSTDAHRRTSAPAPTEPRESSRDPGTGTWCRPG